jgi:hypothetical protein
MPGDLLKMHRVTCQDFEFPVLLVLLYVRVASLFYIERVGPDSPPAMLWPATARVVVR